MKERAKRALPVVTEFAGGGHNTPLEKFIGKGNALVAPRRLQDDAIWRCRMDIEIDRILAFHRRF